MVVSVLAFDDVRKEFEQNDVGVERSVLNIRRTKAKLDAIYVVYLPFQIFLWSVSDSEWTWVLAVIACIVFFLMFLRMQRHLSAFEAAYDRYQLARFEQMLKLCMFEVVYGLKKSEENVACAKGDNIDDSGDNVV